MPVMPEPGFFTRWLITNDSTAKQLMWLLTFFSIVWITWSYVLASTGHEQIAESLSTNVCTVVLGGLVAYLTSSTVQNISKYNPKFGGTPINSSTNYEDDPMPGEIPEEPETSQAPTAGPDEAVPEPNEEVFG